MSAEYFIDTNIFIYAFSMGEPDKRERARNLIGDGLTGSKAVISSQVVQEFLSVAIHKPATNVPAAILEDYLDHVLRPLCGIYPSVSLYGKAIQLHRETQYRFYDCLIVAAALESGARHLYSEDLQSGRRFGDLEIVNPFMER